MSEDVRASEESQTLASEAERPGPAWLMGKLRPDKDPDLFRSETRLSGQGTTGTTSGFVKMTPTDAQKKWNSKMRMSGEALDCLEKGCTECDTNFSDARCSDTVLTFKDVSFEVKQSNGERKEILDAWPAISLGSL
eukprot:g33329.t1